MREQVRYAVGLDSTVDKLMAVAREEEREACARYVDDYRERYGGDWPALEWIAAGIRARNQGGSDIEAARESYDVQTQAESPPSEADNFTFDERLAFALSRDDDNRTTDDWNLIDAAARRVHKMDTALAAAREEALSENARLFHEAVVRSCDETLSRQKHEIRALKARIAELEAKMVGVK